ncbi:MAG: hypothetical protein GEV06_23740 [Luteitalea sp.]|nr:hypothetical protein [Luteitalea sp.]
MRPPFRLRTALLCACTLAPLLVVEAQPPVPRGEVTIVIDSALPPPVDHSAQRCARGQGAESPAVSKRLRGRSDEYQAEVPGADLDRRWDFMYYIEAFDTYGNGRISPDLEIETPYVVVDLHAPNGGSGTRESASSKR